MHYINPLWSTQETWERIALLYPDFSERASNLVAGQGTLADVQDAEARIDAHVLQAEEDDDAEKVQVWQETRAELRRVHRDALAVPAVAQLLDAVTYVLAYAQVDPDLGYLLGPGSEAWVRLVAAEAAALGKDPEAWREERGRDQQPLHRRRDPEVVQLRQHVEP